MKILLNEDELLDILSALTSNIIDSQSRVEICKDFFNSTRKDQARTDMLLALKKRVRETLRQPILMNISVGKVELREIIDGLHTRIRESNNFIETDRDIYGVDTSEEERRNKKLRALHSRLIDAGNSHYKNFGRSNRLSGFLNE